MNSAVNPSITCTRCGQVNPLDKALIHQLVQHDRAAWEAQIREQAAAATRAHFERERAEREETVQEQARQIKELQREQAEFRRERRTFAAEKEGWELEKEKQRDVIRAQERADANASAHQQIEADRLRKDADHMEQLREKDVQIHQRDAHLERLKAELEETRRKADSRPWQEEGQAAPQLLAEELRRRNLGDVITVTDRGKQGADILITVREGTEVCGMILVETKQAREWRDAWLVKLAADARNAGADRAVLVSEMLPKNVERSTMIGGIWLTDFGHSVDLAAGLRREIITDHRHKMSNAGRDNKAAVLYGYVYHGLFGSRANTEEQLVNELEFDHESEKRATLRRWKKKEALIAALREHGMRAAALDILHLTGEIPPGIVDEVDDADAPELGEGDHPPELSA